MNPILQTIKLELKELSKHKLLANSIFVGILCIYGLGVFYPSYFNRKAILYIIFPYILCVYLRHAEQRRVFFILAMCLSAVGEYLFNTVSEIHNALGMVFHGLAFFSYAFVLFTALKIIKPAAVLKFAIPTIFLIWLPTWLFSAGFKTKDMFYEAVFYVVMVTLFLFSSIYTYLTAKSKTNSYLFFAALILLIGSYFEAYNMFIHKNKLSIIVGDLLFYITHYLVCWSFIGLKDKTPVVPKE